VSHAPLEPSRYLVLGTAGHVDHGKTSLVRALTGVDTDRLKEEKERGITIELGFAYLDLPGGQRLGVVDVPGHERFVKAMVAGAAGVDLLALVVAADEGVMPQTREHLAICELLGVRRGVVVLTKVDLVDEEWLQLVEADLQELLVDSALAGARCLRFSAVDPVAEAEGCRALRLELQRLADETVELRSEGLFRLPVDRVFSLRGFGTIVTGTCSAGSVRRQDAVEVLPAGRKARVRSLQVHGEARDEAFAGQRVALNLQGVERSEIERGAVVVREGSLRSSERLDVQVRLLPHVKEALRHGAPVLLHHGASQVEARLWLFEGDSLAPGEAAFAQLRLEQPVVAAPGDRFILRGFWRDERHGATLGGGRVLLAQPPRRRRRDRAATLAALRRIEGGGGPELLEQILADAGPAGIEPGQLCAASGLGLGRVRELCGLALAAGTAVSCDGDGELLLHPQHEAALYERARTLLERFHEEQPRRWGMDREELASRLSGGAVLRSVRGSLERWVAEARLGLSAGQYHLPDFRPQRDAAGEALKDQLVQALAAGGATPPRARDLAEPLGVAAERLEALAGELVGEGRLVRIKEDLVLETGALGALRAQLLTHLRAQGEISPGQFKDLVGGSRRFAIPLAEYFDRTRLTLRVGDLRKLRRDPGDE